MKLFQLLLVIVYSVDAIKISYYTHIQKSSSGEIRTAKKTKIQGARNLDLKMLNFVKNSEKLKMKFKGFEFWS